MVLVGNEPGKGLAVDFEVLSSQIASATAGHG